jgi:hypothetical protein
MEELKKTTPFFGQRIQLPKLNLISNLITLFNFFSYVLWVKPKITGLCEVKVLFVGLTVGSSVIGISPFSPLCFVCLSYCSRPLLSLFSGSACVPQIGWEWRGQSLTNEWINELDLTCYFQHIFNQQRRMLTNVSIQTDDTEKCVLALFSCPRPKIFITLKVNTNAISHRHNNNKQVLERTNMLTFLPTQSGSAFIPT